MFFSRSVGLVASLAALASAAPAGPAAPAAPNSPACPAKPPADPPTYTLPLTGTGTELPSQPANTTLLKIAVGHGIQNYTCANSSATAVNTGALAVLYDVTALYPGTPGTGIPQAVWDNLTYYALWYTDLPLNLQDKAAASPGTPTKPNVLPESSYAAVVANPWGTPEGPANLPTAASGPSNGPAAPAGPAANQPVSVLGHHYFDAQGSPTFNLFGATPAGFFSAAKVSGVHAPPTADKGILDTSAVDWLALKDNGRGLSNGVVVSAYRVVTDAGGAQACSVSGAGSGSVPYSAYYWFFKPSS